MTENEVSRMPINDSPVFSMYTPYNIQAFFSIFNRHQPQAIRIPAPGGFVIRQHHVIFAIFQKFGHAATYYVDMLHAETENPVILSGAPAGCSYKIMPPNPDPSVVAQAAMLDASVRGETGLGSFFAERVRLTCPEK